MQQQPNRVRDLKRRLMWKEHGILGRRSFDHMRAEQCVKKDYWGDNPLFNDHHFQQMFSCTKRVAEKLIEVCIRQKPDIFFDHFKRTQRIRAHIKVLVVLKTLRFGVSFKAFEDYFQMSDVTVHRSFHAVCEVIASDEELLLAFLPNRMTRADATLACQLFATGQSTFVCAMP
jgi:hypothetical protein